MGSQTHVQWPVIIQQQSAASTEPTDARWRSTQCISQCLTGHIIVWKTSLREGRSGLQISRRPSRFCLALFNRISQKVKKRLIQIWNPITCNVTPCSLVWTLRSFTEKCLLLNVSRKKNYTRLHGVTQRKTVVFTATTMRIYNLFILWFKLFEERAEWKKITEKAKTRSWL